MIQQLRGIYFFLSNFYPCNVRFEGMDYPSLENAFQAAKTLDLEERKQFLKCTPSEAKFLGRRVKLRPHWDVDRIDIMFRLLEIKFEDQILKEQLLATGEQTIIEGNTWNDTFWGVCNGKGENTLGKMLMFIRHTKKGGNSNV